VNKVNHTSPLLFSLSDICKGVGGCEESDSFCLTTGCQNSYPPSLRVDNVKEGNIEFTHKFMEEKGPVIRYTRV
jgi:hypothetical protein